MKKIITTVAWIWLFVNVPFLPYVGSLLGLLTSKFSGVDGYFYTIPILLVSAVLAYLVFQLNKNSELTYPTKVLLLGNVFVFTDMLKYAIPYTVPVLSWLRGAVSSINSLLFYFLPLYVIWCISKTTKNYLDKKNKGDAESTK